MKITTFFRLTLKGTLGLYAYVVNRLSNDIWAYEVDFKSGGLLRQHVGYRITAATGALTPLAPATFRTGAQPHSVATAVIP